MRLEFSDTVLFSFVDKKEVMYGYRVRWGPYIFLINLP